MTSDLKAMIRQHHTPRAVMTILRATICEWQAHWVLHEHVGDNGEDDPSVFLGHHRRHCVKHAVCFLRFSVHLCNAGLIKLILTIWDAFRKNREGSRAWHIKMPWSLASSCFRWCNPTLSLSLSLSLCLSASLSLSLSPPNRTWLHCETSSIGTSCMIAMQMH